MRDIVWRVGVTLIALVVLMTLAPNLSFSTTPYRLEEALGQTPQALVSDYLTAVALGDLEAALALWQEPAMPDSSLEVIGTSVSRELAQYGAGMQHQVVDVTWWRTCCEAVTIDDPDTAHVATIRVVISGEDQPGQIYVFETQAGNGTWRGIAASSLRNWVIAGAYLESQVPEAQVWR
jgi:hypothetical protein